MVERAMVRFPRVLALLVLLLAPPRLLAQSCNDSNQCTEVDACRIDGSCAGVPKPDGSPCLSFSPCLVEPKCQEGRCVGTPLGAGTPCGTDTFCGRMTCDGAGHCRTDAIPEHDGQACEPGYQNRCITNPRCQYGSCFGDFKSCPADNDLCTIESCNPNTGECEAGYVLSCGPCETGSCNPSTGRCFTPLDGTACNDYNACTAVDRCEQGTCRGSNPPTATPTDTSAPTQTATSTATPTVAPCAGDCDRDGRVGVHDLVEAVRVLLGAAAPASCSDADLDRNGVVTIDELVGAVAAAVGGCAQTFPR